MKSITSKFIKDGFYLLNDRGLDTGANRVDFSIRGHQINVNHAGYRDATDDEIQGLLDAEARSKEFAATIDDRTPLARYNTDELQSELQKREDVTGDEAIVRRCDVSVRPRVRIELKIVRKTIRELKDAGYELAVQDGETNPDEVNYKASERQLIDSVFGVDESHLLTRKKGVKDSFVFFVLGNDGYDVINDYGVSLEPVLSIVNEYADKLEEEGR